MPHLWATLLVLSTLLLVHAVALEVALSFLGAGIDPPAASLGTLIAAGLDDVVLSPHLLLAPVLRAGPDRALAERAGGGPAAGARSARSARHRRGERPVIGFIGTQAGRRRSSRPGWPRWSCSSSSGRSRTWTRPTCSAAPRRARTRRARGQSRSRDSTIRFRFSTCTSWRASSAATSSASTAAGTCASAFVQALPVTISLVVGAGLIAVGLGRLARLVCVRHRGRWPDRVISAAATAAYSVPSIVLASLLWAFLAYKWNIFPSGDYVPLTDDPFQWAWHLFLPWVAASVPFAGAYVHFVRASLLSVADEDWVRTARAKGLSERSIDPPPRPAKRPDPAGEPLGPRLRARLRRLRALRRGDLRAAGRRGDDGGHDRHLRPARRRRARHLPGDRRRAGRARSWTSRSRGSTPGSGDRVHRREPTPAPCYPRPL